MQRIALRDDCQRDGRPNLVLDVVDAQSRPIADAGADVEVAQADDDAALLETKLVWRHSGRELLVEDGGRQVRAEAFLVLGAAVDALEDDGLSGQHVEDLKGKCSPIRETWSLMAIVCALSAARTHVPFIVSSCCTWPPPKAQSITYRR